MWNLRKRVKLPQNGEKPLTKMVKVQSQPNLWVEASIHADNETVKRDYLSRLGKRVFIFMIGSLVMVLLIGSVVLGRFAIKQKVEPTREELAIDWIFLAPKPIKCYQYGHTLQGNTYTLINAEAGVYMTGPIKMQLSDSIK